MFTLYWIISNTQSKLFFHSSYFVESANPAKLSARKVADLYTTLLDVDGWTLLSFIRVLLRVSLNELLR